MSLRARFAIAFALVGATVAVLVGVLSYHAASERITDEIDRSLASASVSLVGGQTDVLAPVAAVGRDAERDADARRDGEPDDLGDSRRRFVGQAVAPDGAVTFLGGRPVTLPVSDADRALAAAAGGGATTVTETSVGRDEYRVLTTALGGGRGALQVAVDVDETDMVLTGMAVEI